MSGEYGAYGRQEECVQPFARNGRRKNDMRETNDTNVRIILNVIARSS
jgi:hypothetical protein